MHNYASFVVVSTACGALRPIYGGVYTVERYDEGFFPNMDDNVICGFALLRRRLF
jgi:hypothetical protein